MQQQQNGAAAHLLDVPGIAGQADKAAQMAVGPTMSFLLPIHVLPVQFLKLLMLPKVFIGDVP